jgi:hypothetical protein
MNLDEQQVHAIEAIRKTAEEIGFDKAVEALEKHNGPIYNKKITPAMNSTDWAVWLKSKKKEILG